MPRLSERPTGELVVLILAVALSLILLCAGAAITFIVLTRPDTDVSDTVHTFGEFVQVLLGAVVGFLARGYNTRHPTDARGHHDEHDHTGAGTGEEPDDRPEPS